MYDEAERYMSISMFVYLYADMRRVSILGRSKVPFELLAIESDEMTMEEIIRGDTHMIPVFDGDKDTGDESDFFIAGKDGLDIFFLLVRSLAPSALPDIIGALEAFRRIPSKVRALKRMGLSSEALMKLLGEEHDAHEARLVSESIQEQKAQEMLMDDVRDLDAVFGASLRDSCGSSCDNHVGHLCEKRGLHNIQLFMDEVYKLAKTDKKSKDFLDMLGKKEVPTSVCAPSRLSMSLKSDKNTFVEDRRRSSVVTERTIGYRLPKLSSTLMHVNAMVFKPDSIASTLLHTAHSSRGRIVWMNDRNSADELVYIIMASQKTRRVTVVFRGSVTLTDWSHNLSYDPMKIKNPISERYEGKSPTIEYNEGYYNYLCKPRLDNGRSKFDEIADKVHEYGEEIAGPEGYTLVTTGHSLGGALATLFGFYASNDDRFTNYGNAVRVFTFGSPIFGRISFAKAFQHQEQKGRLMHARFVNEKDIIPHGRSLGHLFTTDLAHSGLELRLKNVFPGTKVTNPVSSIEYIQDKAWWGTLGANFKNHILLKLFTVLPIHIHVAHSVKLYNFLLGLAKQAEGNDRSLDELYRDYRILPGFGGSKECNPTKTAIRNRDLHKIFFIGTFLLFSGAVLICWNTAISDLVTEWVIDRWVDLFAKN